MWSISEKNRILNPSNHHMKNTLLILILLAMNVATAQVELEPAVQLDDSTVEQIVTFPDEEATFPGGMIGMQRWLAENIVYPEDAINQEIMGTVYVQFVIETDGSITNAKIMRSPHDLLSEEGLRLVTMMPKWIPGKMNGMPVRSLYRLPFRFYVD